MLQEFQTLQAPAAVAPSFVALFDRLVKMLA
jgi:hypothetical protein